MRDSTWGGRLGLLALVAALNLGLGACSRAWPRVNGVAAADFASHRRAVRTVDVLPVDVQVWTGPGTRSDPDAVRRQFESDVDATVEGELAGRSYQVLAAMDWTGNFTGPDGLRYQSMTPTEVVETDRALSSYGRAVAQAHQGLLQPYLPHRLGAKTGADATLYVGGWAYVGKKPKTSGDKVAKGVLIGLVVVAVVAIVIIAVASKGKGGGLGGLGRAAAATGRVAGKVASGMARTAARLGAHVVRGALRAADTLSRADLDFDVDCYGHTQTHIQVSPMRPAYHEQRDTPRRGESQLYLEMTLIDNATGVTLWHARQRFRAHAADPGDARQVVRRMLASLPANVRP